MYMVHSLKYMIVNLNRTCMNSETSFSTEYFQGGTPDYDEATNTQLHPFQY